MTISVLPQVTIIFLLIFARVGTLFMLMPGFSNQAINARLRLSIALMVTLVMFPLLQPRFGDVPTDLVQVLALLGRELLIGFVLGLTAAFVISTTQVAGTIIANQVGLAYSQTFDPTQGVQGVVLGSFLSTLAAVMIFVTDLHHLAIGAMFASYDLFNPGATADAESAFMLAVRMVSQSFSIATQMSAPFLVFGLIFYLGIGVLSRLMPQVQIFFVAMPATIAIGLVILALILGTMMGWYLMYVRDVLNMLAGG
ncbi:MAG: flagellar biosynthetic protein FliR [Pseudomonadota bacterium]